jgi:hypothetical protein
MRSPIEWMRPRATIEGWTLREVTNARRFFCNGQTASGGYRRRHDTASGQNQVYFSLGQPIDGGDNHGSDFEAMD